MSTIRPCTGIRGPIRGLWRAMSEPLMTFWRSLAKVPKNSLMFSGSKCRSMPAARNRSINCIVVVLPTKQSVWPMMAISLPPLTAQAKASERMVLESGPVMMLPALRNQMKSSASTPSTFGKSAFNRGSMQVRATTGSSSSKSLGCTPALWSPATARWLASMMASKRRMVITYAVAKALGLPIKK